MTATHETTEFLTDAPAEYDGFSTRSLAIVGVSRRRGNPVRRVLVELRDLEWQTQRYLSGDHLFTTPERKPETFTRHGDWILTDWLAGIDDPRRPHMLAALRDAAELIESLLCQLDEAGLPGRQRSEGVVYLIDRTIEAAKGMQ